MAFKPVKSNAPAAAKPAAAPKAGGKPQGVIDKTLRMLPYDAESIEKTNEQGETYISWPWVYLGNMFKELKEGKYGTYTQIEMKTRVDEDDPHFIQDRYSVKPGRDGAPPTLVKTPGHRVKVFGDAPKAADGRKFAQTDDAKVLCELTQMLTKSGSPKEGCWEGKDAMGNTWQVLKYQSKEEREKRKAGGGGNNVDGLADF